MKYSDIVPDYEKYKTLQTSLYQSWESEHPEWSEPQRKAILEYFGPIPRDAKILDAGCGDGFGLSVLRSMGFNEVRGLDMAQDKVGKAHAKDFIVYEEDLHTWCPPAYAKLFDVIYASHSLEHCYMPGVVVGNFYKLLRDDGKLIVILPYPDLGVDEAHGGKYELGTVEDDGLVAVTEFFRKHGFEIVKHGFSERTGREVVLVMNKIERKREPTHKSK